MPDTGASSDGVEAVGATLFVLGADGALGRDLFLRILYGGQVSLLVGLGATFLALLIGVPLGLWSGLRGGASDRSLMWVTELFMGFPVLLFLVAVGYTVGPRFSDVTLGGLVAPGVLVLVLLLGSFSWFVPARLVREHVRTLRGEDFIEAARMLGSSDGRLLRVHVFPHVVGPVLAWSVLTTAGFVILEAAISMLNVGVKLPTASWGTLMSTNWGTLLVFNPSAPNNQTGYYAVNSNWVLFWPTLALFVTIVALALFGEALRRRVGGTDWDS